MSTRAVSPDPSPSPAGRAPVGPAHLDELAQLPVETLEGLYRDAAPPQSLEALAGAPVGRMLSVRGALNRPGARAQLAAIARAPWFPWSGKSFTAFSADEGEGVNRVKLLGDQFRFELRFATSVIDGDPCVFLEYDLPENPWLIRQIHDELRELRPGLFLGPAMWKTRRAPVLVLWFAIDAR